MNDPQREEIVNDVKDSILDYWDANGHTEEVLEALASKSPEDVADDWMDIMDEVTGNADGSFWMSRKKAQDYIKDKWHVVKDALKDGMMSIDDLEDEEVVDVCLRCYVFPDALLKAVKEVAE
jgi:hypothetical protein